MATRGTKRNVFNVTSQLCFPAVVGCLPWSYPLVLLQSPEWEIKTTCVMHCPCQINKEDKLSSNYVLSLTSVFITISQMNPGSSWTSTPSARELAGCVGSLKQFDNWCPTKLKPKHRLATQQLSGLIRTTSVFPAPCSSRRMFATPWRRSKI